MDSPKSFCDPFSSAPHPLAVLAAGELRDWLEAEDVLREEISSGKMFGVLVVEVPGTVSGTLSDSSLRESAPEVIPASEHLLSAPEINAVGGKRQLAFLAAFSGLLQGRNDFPYFVPPVFDFLDPAGTFKTREREITGLNSVIGSLESDPDYASFRKNFESVKNAAEQEVSSYRRMMLDSKTKRDILRSEGASEAELVRESQFQKAELRRLKKRCEKLVENAARPLEQFLSRLSNLKSQRQQMSDELQKWLFSQFRFLNAAGVTKNLSEIFNEYAFVTASPSPLRRIPPAGAGECCAPKLLNYAFLHGLKPLCLAEFWWGRSPLGQVRHHLQFYPPCQGKCRPILNFMLKGLDTEKEPAPDCAAALDVVYEDSVLAVLLKPAKLLSVPGKGSGDSVYSIVRQMFPYADGPLLAHRLDYDTSGLLLVAKSKASHTALQEQFERREVRKKYIALVRSDGKLQEGKSGMIDLPISPDYLDRPKQIVDTQNGKPAVTEYVVLSSGEGVARLELCPHTGRTHQLRLHCAHPLGLGTPILGDPLYGKEALMTSAQSKNPATELSGKNVGSTAECGEEKTEGRIHGATESRMFLHAAELTFRHPVTGQTLTFRSEPGF